MKKIIILFLFGLLIITGCGKMSEKDVLKEIENQITKSKGYEMSGELTITNHDEVYLYDVLVDYKKDDYYKVSIVNQNNQFQQVILKNDDGVFLVTPSLNKSFKFQSDWPYQNSQAYLLQCILSDLKDDKDLIFEKKKEKYHFQSKVHYPNNSKLSYQKVTFDSNFQLEKVVVYNTDDVICMEFHVEDIHYSPKFSSDFFDLDRLIDVDLEDEATQESEEAKETSVIEDVIYPLLLPDGTKLVGEEKVPKNTGERVIMTYDGEKSFLLVEETLDVFDEFTIIPSSGEPFQLMDTIGVMRENSLSWSSGNLEYYLVSDVMSREELVEVAQSIVGVTSLK